MKTKRLLAALLAIIMVFSMLPVSLAAADENSGGGTETCNRIYVKKPADWSNVRLWVWSDGGTGEATLGVADWSSRPTLKHYGGDIYYYEDTNGTLQDGYNFILNSDSSTSHTTNSRTNLQLNKLYVLEPNPETPIVYGLDSEEFTSVEPAYNKLIYSTDDIDHSWYTLTNNGDVVAVLDKPDGVYPTYNKNGCNPVNTGAADMSEGGTIKTMPENTWAYGYVVEFSGAANISLPIGGHLYNLSNGTHNRGQGYNVNCQSYVTQFTVPSAGVYVIMTAAQNFYNANNTMRFIKEVGVCYIRKQSGSAVNVRVLGSVAATIDDRTTVTGTDGATDPSLYYSELKMTVDGNDYTFSGLTAGAIGKNEDGTIKYSQVDNRAMPEFKLIIDKPTAPAANEGYVNNLVGFATEEGGEATVNYTDNGDGKITLDGYARELYPVWFETPNVAAPEKQAGSFEKGSVTKLPQGEGTSLKQTTVWQGNADFGDTLVDGLTIVFKMDGVAEPITGGRVLTDTTVRRKGTGDPVTASGGYATSTESWGYSANNGTWDFSGKNSGDPELPAMYFGTINSNGYYYIYYNVKPLDMNQGQNIIKGLTKYRIFNGSWTNNGKKAQSNPNANATFQMLAVVASNLQPTVNFVFDGTSHEYSIKYTDLSGNPPNGHDWETVVRGSLISVDDAFNSLNIPAPEAPNDGKTYKLVWVDEYKQPVEAIYKSQNLYADFVEVDADNCNVSFKNTNGSVIAQNDLTKGMTFAEIKTAVGIADQTKVETDDEAYTFKGWTADGETIVSDDDVINADSVVFSPVFVADQKIKATLTGDLKVALNGSVTLGIKLNRADITTDVVGGVKAPIANGTVTVSTTGLTNAEGETTFDVTFDEVNENGVTNATVTLNAIPDYSVNYTVTLSGVAATAAGAEASVYETSAKVSTSENWVGTFFDENANKVTLEKDKIESTPIWNGSVDFGANYRGVTFIFKVEGIETPLDVTGFDFKYNGNKMSDTWFYKNQWSGRYSCQVSFDNGDGYYLVYYNDRMTYNSSHNFKTISDLSFFVRPTGGDASITGSNSNENAAVSLIGVVALDLQPIVTFHDAVGNVYGDSYQKKYTNVGNNQPYNDPNGVTKQVIKLATIEEILEESAIAAPAKAEDDENTYVFDKWVDADGNDVSGSYLYKSVDLYPSYTAVPKTTAYDVVFMNGESQFGDTQSVYEYGNPSVPAEAPAKADDATGYFTFKGWSLDGETVVDVTTVSITANTTFYAVFEHTNVEFTVTYMDGETVVKTETVVRSKNTTPPEMKRKYDAYDHNNADDHAGKKYYDFIGWVDADGTAIDLTGAVTSDITAYAQYEEHPIETWHSVSWQNENNVQVTWQWVADGDTANEVGAWGWVLNQLPKHNTADENYWYTFSGWDEDTTNVTSDMTVHPVYTETPVATTPITITGEKITGKVGEPHVMFNGSLDLSANPPVAIAVIVDIKGASEDNPVVLGSIKLDANNSSSNSCGNMPAKNASNPKTTFTSDGKYLIKFGASTMGNYMYNGEWVIGKLSHVGIDDPDATRGYTTVDASGEATYTSYLIAGDFNPEVRFYGADGEWLYTGKYTYNTWHSMIEVASLPTPADLYKVSLPDNFVYWADADGNRVDYVTDNMDLHAVCHTHTYAVTAPGVITCTDADCPLEEGRVISNAPTVTANEDSIFNVKAGETIEVPVIITNNPGVVGITFDVQTSDNVELTSVSLDGTIFAGATIDVGTSVVINKGESAENISADGTVAVLTLTAKTDINGGDTVDVKINVTDTADTDLNQPVIYSGYTASKDVIYVAAKVTDSNGNVSYAPSFKEAIAMANNGDTVMLLDDVTISNNAEKVSVDKPITIDLGGHTVTGKVNFGIMISADAEVKNGSVIAASNTNAVYSSGAHLVLRDLTLRATKNTVNLGKAVESVNIVNCDIKATQPSSGNSYEPAVNNTTAAGIITIENSHIETAGKYAIYSGLNGISTVEVKNSHIIAVNSAVFADYQGMKLTVDATSSVTETGNASTSGAIAISGSNSAVDIYGTVSSVSGCGIVTNGTKSNNTITVHAGATVESNGSAAMYLPSQDSTTVIEGTVKGLDSAVEIRGGNLEVKDGAILTATSTQFTAEGAGSASTVRGAAVAVVQHTTKDDMNIVISGGTLNGVKSLYQADLQGNNTNNVTLSVTGGDFTGDVDTEIKGYISGGIFASLPAVDLCSESYSAVQKDDGGYIVEQTEAIINFNKFSFTVGNTMSLNTDVYYQPIAGEAVTSFELKVEYKDADGNWVVLGSDIKEVTDGSPIIDFKIDGIPMVYLSNDIRLTFIAGISTKSIETMLLNGESVPISFANYSKLAKDLNADNAELTALLNTMLNYTAAIQEYKGYNTDSLANAALTDDEKAAIKSIENYTDADWAAYSAMKRGVSVKADATVKFTGSKLLMGSDKTGFRLVFSVAEGTDISGLEMRINCNGVLAATVSGADFKAGTDGTYYADFDGFDPTNFDTQVTAAVFNGSARVSNVAYDSIPATAKYVATNDKYANMRPVLSAMLAYNATAKEYFNKANPSDEGGNK